MVAKIEDSRPGSLIGQHGGNSKGNLRSIGETLWFARLRDPDEWFYVDGRLTVSSKGYPGLLKRAFGQELFDLTAPSYRKNLWRRWVALGNSPCLIAFAVEGGRLDCKPRIPGPETSCARTTEGCEDHNIVCPLRGGRWV